MRHKHTNSETKTKMAASSVTGTGKKKRHRSITLINHSRTCSSARENIGRATAPPCRTAICTLLLLYIPPKKIYSLWNEQRHQFLHAKDPGKWWKWKCTCFVFLEVLFVYWRHYLFFYICGGINAMEGKIWISNVRFGFDFVTGWRCSFFFFCIHTISLSRHPNISILDIDR